MSQLTIVLLIITVVLVGILILLYFMGKRAQKRQDEQTELVNRTAQPVSMLIIDKKRLRVTKSGLPQEVIDQTPFYLRRSKMPVVKAKVGPRMMTLMCDPMIFDSIPVKKEVKAMVSGIYISSVRGLHGKLEAPSKKKGLRGKLNDFVMRNRGN